MKRIEITSYQKKWPQEFQNIKAKILNSIDHDCPIEHIGSTSIPNMPAKNIIDIQLGIDDFDQVELIQPALEKLGLKFVKGFVVDHIPFASREKTNSQWEKRFFKGIVDGRFVHLHIRKINNPNWDYATIWRDYMRENKPARTAFAEFKQRLSINLTDLKNYADIKDPVCDLIYLLATPKMK